MSSWMATRSAASPVSEGESDVLDKESKDGGGILDFPFP